MTTAVADGIHLCLLCFVSASKEIKRNYVDGSVLVGWKRGDRRRCRQRRPQLHAPVRNEDTQIKKKKPKNQWPKKDQWYQLERNKNAPGPDALSLPLSFCTMGPFCRPRFSRHGGHRYLLDTTHEPALSGKTCLRIETSECVCRDVLNNENHFRMAVTGVWTRTLLKTAGCGRLVTDSDLRGWFR